MLGGLKRPSRCQSAWDPRELYPDNRTYTSCLWVFDYRIMRNRQSESSPYIIVHSKSKQGWSGGPYANRANFKERDHVRRRTSSLKLDEFTFKR